MNQPGQESVRRANDSELKVQGKSVHHLPANLSLSHFLPRASFHLKSQVPPVSLAKFAESQKTTMSHFLEIQYLSFAMLR